MPPKNIRIFLGFVVFTLHRPPSVQYLAAVGSVKGHHYWSVYCRRCRVGSVQDHRRFSTWPRLVPQRASVGSVQNRHMFSTVPPLISTEPP